MVQPTGPTARHKHPVASKKEQGMPAQTAPSVRSGYDRIMNENAGTGTPMIK